MLGLFLLVACGAKVGERAPDRDAASSEASVVDVAHDAPEPACSGLLLFQSDSGDTECAGARQAVACAGVDKQTGSTINAICPSDGAVTCPPDGANWASVSCSALCRGDEFAIWCSSRVSFVDGAPDLPTGSLPPSCRTVANGPEVGVSCCSCR